MVRLTGEHAPMIPAELEGAMRMFREGWAALPPAFIAYHEALAARELKELQAVYAITVHRTWLDRDGWMDGMRTTHAIVETQDGRLLKLQWHDGNRAFMKAHAQHGGASVLLDADLGPVHCACGAAGRAPSTCPVHDMGGDL